MFQICQNEDRDDEYARLLGADPSTMRTLENRGPLHSDDCRSHNYEVKPLIGKRYNYLTKCLEKTINLKSMFE